MNCEQFQQRMHQLLDRRQTLGRDGQLRSHAAQCESCRAQLDMWQQVSSIMPIAETEQQPSGSARPLVRSGVLALAAAVLVAFIVPATLVSWDLVSIDRLAPWRVVGPTAKVDSSGSPIGDPPEFDPPEFDPPGLESPSRVSVSSGGELDPALWWNTVQKRDWVGQTMPTVRSVQESVAPIGRSLLRAVSILTLGGRNQTS